MGSYRGPALLATRGYLHEKLISLIRDVCDDDAAPEE
jgi:hypothetical protein